MLNPFPELLSFSILAPTLLRIGVSLVLLYTATSIWTQRESVEGGSRTASLFFASAAVGIASFIIAGAQTQVAALLLAAFSLFGFVAKGNMSHLAPLERSTYALLFSIALALLFTGAGAFAFDIAL